jgi:hypothetical protein
LLKKNLESGITVKRTLEILAKLNYSFPGEFGKEFNAIYSRKPTVKEFLRFGDFVKSSFNRTSLRGNIFSRPPFLLKANASAKTEDGGEGEGGGKGDGKGEGEGEGR